MHSSSKIYGSVSTNLPLPSPYVTGGLGILIICFIVCGLNTDFAEKYTVQGYLNTKLGATLVYASRPGVIGRSFVVAGQQVNAGSALFLIHTATDKNAFLAEQTVLTTRLARIAKKIQEKTQYLHTIKPLLTTHHLSVSAYQTYRDQLSDLEAQRHDIQLAMIHHQQERAYLVRAPMSGLISNLEAHQGQTIILTHPLLTLLPDDSELIAQLYVPVAKSGFLQVGDRVALRYDAYPYQHFGIANAYIQSISQSIMRDQDEEKPIKIGEPYYKVLARLERQDIVFSDRKHPLKQGMTCTAVITGVHRKFWQWLFDPLRHLAGG